MHRHRWRITDRTVLDSPLDKMIANGLKSMNSRSSEDTRTFTHRPAIVSYRCERCGTEKVVRV